MNIDQRAQSIQTAALNQDFDTVKSLLESNQSLINSIDEDKRTALHWTCVSGDVRIFRFLLTVDTDEAPSPARIKEQDHDGKVGSFGMDINVQDEGGWTPLMIAISAGYEEIYQTLLLLPSLQINQTNRGGQTVLHFACSKLRLPAVETILATAEGKKLVRIKDRQGQLPLHRAAAVGSAPIVRMLIAAGTQLSVGDAGGWTALHHACSEGHGEVAVLLIEEGIDVQKTDRDDETAMQLCPPDGKCENYIRMHCSDSF